MNNFSVYLEPGQIIKLSMRPAKFWWNIVGFFLKIGMFENTFSIGDKKKNLRIISPLWSAFWMSIVQGSLDPNVDEANWGTGHDIAHNQKHHLSSPTCFFQFITQSSLINHNPIHCYI